MSNSNCLLVAKIFQKLDDYFFFDGTNCIRIRPLDGGSLPVAPGWNPRRIIIGMQHVNIMELVHTKGSTSLWFLDCYYRFRANKIERISCEAQSELMNNIPTFPEVDWGSLKESPAAPDHIQQCPVDYRLLRLENAYIKNLAIFNPKTPFELSTYQNFWLKNDYVKIDNALTREALRLLSESLTFDSLNALNDHRQFHRIHNDHNCIPFIKEFHTAVHEYYETILSSDLLRCSAFAMKYTPNSDLHPHYDNINTQISSTVCYHVEPIGCRNPIFVDKAKFLNPYQQRVTVYGKDLIR